MNGSSPTIVSRLAVAADLTTQSLVEIDVPGLSIQRDLRAVWRHGVELSPLAAALLAQLPNL
jgi:DNA-binding transcriptional LysR family regulator